LRTAIFHSSVLDWATPAQTFVKTLIGLYICEFSDRIARHASGNLSMDLFRVPEDKMQQNLDFLEKIIEKGHNAGEIALAAAEVLPDAHIGNPHILSKQT
jgi:hypothetical protein